MTAKPSSDPSRRGLLLDTAARLIERHGPNRTTVADIAREAGVSVGSVYLAFKGKGDILAALSARRLEQVVAAMRDAAADQPDPARRVCAALRARTDTLLALAVEGPVEDIARCECSGLTAAWQAFRAESDALIGALVAEGVAEGTLVGPPGESTEALLRAYAVFLPPSLRRLPADAVGPGLAAMHRLVLDGLRPREAR